jgi:hypothetical protein
LKPPMSDNQHYVTKAHLDKFVHPNTGQNVLFPFERGIGRRKATGTKQLASANHFYAERDGEVLVNRIDVIRKHAEARLFASGRRTAGPIAKCIYEDKYTPNPEERFALVQAAALLRWGSPVEIHNTAMLSLLCQQVFAFNLLNSEQAKEEYQKSYGDQAEERIQLDREALQTGDLVIDVGEENWKQLGFEAYKFEEVFIDAVSRMGLTICTAHYKSFFITSDNPVVLTSDSQSDSPGLALRDAQVWFPISYRRGLLWSWKHSGVERDYFNHSETRKMNRRMVRWCYKHVYSPLAEDWIEAAVKEVSFNPCFGHYGTLQRVMDAHSAPAVMGPGAGERVGNIVDLIAGLRSGQKCDVVNL